MGFSTVPCNEFVEVLASKAPVPGGGGASALVSDNFPLSFETYDLAVVGDISITTFKKL